MTEPSTTETEQLERAFDALRRSPPDVPKGLLERIESDAVAALSDNARPAAPSHPAREGFFSWIGGWQGASGLLAASVAGLAIGVFQPVSLSVGLTADEELVLFEAEVLPDISGSLEEGLADG